MVEVETPTASPFASSLLFDYVATYMYEGDTPNAERRAAALSLDRELLRELLGQEELRDLIDPGALEDVEADLQFRSEHRRATSKDDAPRHPARRSATSRSRRCATRVLRRPRRRPDARRSSFESGGRSRFAAPRQERFIDAADAGLYRDALGVAPPGGLPAAFLEDVPDALAPPRARATRRRTGRSRRTSLRARYGVDPTAALSELERGRRARPRRAAARWQRARVVPSRGAPAPAPRIARRAAQGDRAGRPARARPLPARLAGRRPPAPRRAPASTGCARSSSRCRGSRCRPRRGSATCFRAASARTRRRGWTSYARAGSSCGSAPARSGGTPGGSRSTSVRTSRYWPRQPPSSKGTPPDSDAHALVRERLARGACFFTDLLVDVELAPEALQEALWDLVWAGEATNDAFAPLRAPRLTLARAQRERARTAARRSGRFAASRAAGHGRRRRRCRVAGR